MVNTRTDVRVELNKIISAENEVVNRQHASEKDVMYGIIPWQRSEYHGVNRLEAS